ncbi:hypothetical protein Ga0466249_001689 [Sporomusaceae bacterium BoRhaA]|nr:hypothetical protein [Pelorhabdus rhamnosifermentans]
MCYKGEEYQWLQFTLNSAQKSDLPEPPKPEDYDPDEDLVKVFTGSEIITLESHGKPMYPGTPSAWFPDFCVLNMACLN